MSRILAPGEPAPDFTLRVTPDQNLSLGEFRGRPVILAFYPADWSPVCGNQMTLYNQVRSEFQKHGAEVLGISVDGAWRHQAYVKHKDIHFPLLANFEPKGATARKSPIAVDPGADGMLDTLERLSQRETPRRDHAAHAPAGDAP